MDYLIWVYGSSTTGACRHVNSDYGITTANWKGGLREEEHQLGHCSGPVSCHWQAERGQARPIGFSILSSDSGTNRGLATLEQPGLPGDASWSVEDASSFSESSQSSA